MDTKLKQLRTERNISQEDLASIIGVSARSLSRYEKGTAYPQVDADIKLAAFYGMLVEDLFQAEKG